MAELLFRSFDRQSTDFYKDFLLKWTIVFYNPNDMDQIYRQVILTLNKSQFLLWDVGESMGTNVVIVSLNYILISTTTKILYCGEKEAIVSCFGFERGLKCLTWATLGFNKFFCFKQKIHPGIIKS